MPPAVVLVGPPGAGKTTVGHLLAERLGVPLRDTDDDVEQAAGSPIADIFVDEGEAGFRAREKAAVTRALATDNTVVCLGGGAVGSSEVREALAALPVAYLSVTASEAAKRAGIAGARPLLLGKVRTQWTALMRERAPLYEAVATFQIPTDHREPADVADELAAILTEEPR